MNDHEMHLFLCDLLEITLRYQSTLAEMPGDTEQIVRLRHRIEVLEKKLSTRNKPD